MGAVRFGRPSENLCNDQGTQNMAGRYRYTRGRFHGDISYVANSFLSLIDQPSPSVMSLLPATSCYIPAAYLALGPQHVPANQPVSALHIQLAFFFFFHVGTVVVVLGRVAVEL